MHKTLLKVISSDISLDYTSKCVFVGSCFSENISQRMKQAGLMAESNPLGVLFNPISVANALNNHDVILTQNAFLKKDNIFLNWHANSKVYGVDDLEVFQEELKLNLQEFKEKLSSADVLFVTLGSAFVYRFLEDDIRVANCHKVPQKKFNKEFLSVSEMLVVWKEVLNHLHTMNPKLKVVFTVSPVRHVKDGLVENNRSKARLFELISRLEQEGAYYFPAYELVMDECRDYAYFEADGVHPNAFAIDRVWEYFCATYFSTETQGIMKQYLGFQSFFRHKSLHPESVSSLKAMQQQKEKYADFLEKHPFINTKE
ncbi:GSCFA domain-containing protein [Lishizhenia sp.]|uniref:GSCFA domain-containing protein n=1 Tax=Lishizhenia sp. TaxID=2497594 RepID=UPI00299F148A|nr:GSCFA domain-containing protein [Lishizhenia sp.]MDX1444851.1 GSCFA domain-containing protein [Lishizhenia sp.]